MMEKIKLGVIQPEIEPYSVSENLEHLSAMLDRLRGQGVRFAVLPEFFPTGNTLEPELLRVAVQSKGEVERWLREQAEEKGMIIAGAYLSLEGENVFNRFVVREPGGRVTSRLKTRSPVFESIYYRVAKESEPILDTGIGRVGAIICVESFFEEVILTDYSDCSVVIVVFAIPDRMCVLPAVRRRLTKVPQQLAERNGIPVVVCGLGGRFRTGGSPIQPMRMKGRFAGRSGIYLPSGPVAGPLPPGGDETIVAEVPLGPGVERPDPYVKVQAGLPFYMGILDRILEKRADRIYTDNLKSWLPGG